MDGQESGDRPSGHTGAPCPRTSTSPTAAQLPLGPRRAPGSRLRHGLNAETAVTDKTYEGPVGVVDWARDIFEAFDRTPRFEIEEVVARGADFVVTMNRIAATGARSGAPLLFRWAAVYWVRDGKLARVVGYLRRREALRAVELAE